MTIIQIISDTMSGIPTSTEFEERELRKREKKAKEKNKSEQPIVKI